MILGIWTDRKGSISLGVLLDIGGRAVGSVKSLKYCIWKQGCYTAEGTAVLEKLW